MNGSTATITGVTWTGGNHGIHMLDPNTSVLFNNNNNGLGRIDRVRDHVTNGNTATKGWTYTASPAIANMVMGDVQRMPNGNVIVGYSTRGALHEVSSTGTRLQQWRWASGAQFRIHREARDACTVRRRGNRSPSDAPEGPEMNTQISLLLAVSLFLHPRRLRKRLALGRPAVAPARRSPPPSSRSSAGARTWSRTRSNNYAFSQHDHAAAGHGEVEGEPDVRLGRGDEGLPQALAQHDGRPEHDLAAVWAAPALRAAAEAERRRALPCRSLGRAAAQPGRLGGHHGRRPRRAALRLHVNGIDDRCGHFDMYFDPAIFPAAVLVHDRGVERNGRRAGVPDAADVQPRCRRRATRPSR